MPLGSKRPPLITSATAPGAVPASTSASKDYVPLEKENRTEPSLRYRESGERWMERQEAQSLRRALEDMDLQEEQRLRAAAQDEASEMVWKHQNPHTPYRSPEKSQDYCEHFRQGSYARSLHRQSSSIGQQDASSNQNRWSVSGGSQSSVSLESTQTSSKSSSSSTAVAESRTGTVTANMDDYGDPKTEKDSKDGSTDLEPRSKPLPEVEPKSRRPSSASRRRVSKGASIGVFEDPTNSMYEGPQKEPSLGSAEAPEANSPPPQVGRNPFARIHLAQERLSRSNTEPTLRIKKLDRCEIQKNPVSRSRNPFYMANPAPPTPPKSNSSKENLEGQDENNPRFKNGQLSSLPSTAITSLNICSSNSMRLCRSYNGTTHCCW